MIRRYNYVLLLGGLLFMLVGGAFGTQTPHLSTRVVVDVTLVGVFGLGVWSLVESKIAFIAGWILAALTLALVLGAHATELVMLEILALVAVLVFLTLACIIAVVDVLFFGGPR